jgi:VanZ family protein
MGALGRLWQKRGGFWVDVAPALLYLGLLFYFGLVPLKHLPGPEFKLADKVWHAGAFGGVAGLLSRVLTFFGARGLPAARWAALTAVALGGLLEILQSFTPFRSADWADFVADSLGALLAYAVLRLLNAAPQPETA